MTLAYLFTIRLLRIQLGFVCFTVVNLNFVKLFESFEFFGALNKISMHCGRVGIWDYLQWAN